MNTPCIEWTGKTDRCGYGRLLLPDGRGAMAHRVAYERVNGPIPDGLTVDHLCFTPRCVNPAHMRLLTPAENASNQRSAYKTHCVNGHEFTSDNTYIRPAKYRAGKRDCRTCIRERVARYRAKRAAA